MCTQTKQCLLSLIMRGSKESISPSNLINNNPTSQWPAFDHLFLSSTHFFEIFILFFDWSFSLCSSSFYSFLLIIFLYISLSFPFFHFFLHVFFVVYSNLKKRTFCCFFSFLSMPFAIIFFSTSHVFLLFYRGFFSFTSLHALFFF